MLLHIEKVKEWDSNSTIDRFCIKLGGGDLSGGVVEEG